MGVAGNVTIPAQGRGISSVSSGFPAKAARVNSSSHLRSLPSVLFVPFVSFVVIPAFPPPSALCPPFRFSVRGAGASAQLFETDLPGELRQGDLPCEAARLAGEPVGPLQPQLPEEERRGTLPTMVSSVPPMPRHRSTWRTSAHLLIHCSWRASHRDEQISASDSLISSTSGSICRAARSRWLDRRS